MKKIIKLFIVLTALISSISIGAIDTSRLSFKGKMKMATYFYGNNAKVVRKSVMEVSFINDVENEYLYLCFETLMGISISKRSIKFLLEDIEKGIEIEADNINKSIKEKDFTPKAVNDEGIPVDFIPVLKNWNKYYSCLIVGTCYTKNIKDFRLLFCLNEYNEDETIGKGYMYFALDHDEIRVFQKILQDCVVIKDSE